MRKIDTASAGDGWGTVPTTDPALQASDPSAATAATQAVQSQNQTTLQTTAAKMLPPPPLPPEMQGTPLGVWLYKLWQNRVGGAFGVSIDDLAILEAVADSDSSGMSGLTSALDDAGVLQALEDSSSGLGPVQVHLADLDAGLAYPDPSPPAQDILGALAGEGLFPVSIPVAGPSLADLESMYTPYKVASAASADTATSATSATTATNSTNAAITDDTTTNATMYPVWVTANTGNLPLKVTSTKLSYNPSTGVLTVTGGTGTVALGGTSQTLTGTFAGSLDWRVTNSDNGTSAQAKMSVINDASVNGNLRVNGSGVVATRFGIASGNYVEITAVGASCNGLLIGPAAINKPMIFGVNASEVARFSSGTLSTGTWSISYTTDATSSTTGAETIAGGLGVAKTAIINKLMAALASVIPSGTTVVVPVGTQYNLFDLMEVDGVFECDGVCNVL